MAEKNHAWIMQWSDPAIRRETNIVVFAVAPTRARARRFRKQNNDGYWIIQPPLKVGKDEVEKLREVGRRDDWGIDFYYQLVDQMVNHG